MDTINANGGNAGLHHSVFKKYFQPLKDKAVEETGQDLAALAAAELETTETEATMNTKEAAQGEYFACLFLLLVDDERYGPLKTQLDNNFLMGKQEYPSNVLSAKRLMPDFVPVTGVVKHKRQESGPSNVAFVKTKGRREVYPHMLLMWRVTRGRVQKVPQRIGGGAPVNDQGSQSGTLPEEPGQRQHN